MEEVGDLKPTPFLYKPGLFEAKGQSFLQSYAVGKPSQSQFVAGKPLRWKRCRIVSGSLEHQFCMPFLALGSRDLGQQDQISLVAFGHC